MANLTGNGFIAPSVGWQRPSLDSLIEQLVADAKRAIHHPDDEGVKRKAVVLRGKKYKEKVYRAMCREQVVVVPLKGEVVKRGYYEIKLDQYFESHGYRD